MKEGAKGIYPATDMILILPMGLLSEKQMIMPKLEKRIIICLPELTRLNQLL